jgi:predicted transcriptional regulator
MATTGIKSEARRLVEELPEDSTWDDLVYRIYLHEAIEQGRRDIREGRVFTTADVRKNLGLSE